MSEKPDDKQIAFTVPDQAHAAYKVACAKLRRTMADDLRGRVIITLQEAEMLEQLDTDVLVRLYGGEDEKCER